MNTDRESYLYPVVAISAWGSLYVVSKPVLDVVPPFLLNTGSAVRSSLDWWDRRLELGIGSGCALHGMDLHGHSFFGISDCLVRKQIDVVCFIPFSR